MTTAGDPMDAVRGAREYELKSELARVCLPSSRRNPEQKLAWVNSLCILFLLIGLTGAQSKLPLPKKPAPLEEAVPAILEPLPPPPPTAPAENQEQNDQDKSEAPRVVVVTPDSPAIHFSIPTIGNLVVPNAIAVAPPAAPLKASARSGPPKDTILGTGFGGDRPWPTYPKLALELGQQGTVVLILVGDDSGKIVSVSVKQSSGSAILDQSAEEFVKRHWILPVEPGLHTYEAPISYKLQ